MKLWIARDESGYLYLHEEKPKMQYNFQLREWCSNETMELNPDFFPEVTFENSPMEVELVLKK